MFKLFRSKKEKTGSVPAEAVSMQPSVKTVQNEGGELSGKMSDRKLIAVISAAIAAFRNESDCAFDIISINKIS
ncbi:MAG: hypothetical protein PHD46_05315 [Eubacteriales bacterium]|nr:hypothetical protein [Eubacteriales bacterium]MDD4422436.1 hypothetical protein [Eubacteriales bacterium]HBR32734.1 hypothetical protein [Clostridiales bacterium]